MASATYNGNDDFEGAKSIHEDDGGITAHDIEAGLTRGGDTRAEALSQLAEVLVLHEGGGEPITDDGLEKLDLGLDEFGNHELPDLMQQMVWKTFSGRGITKAPTKHGYISRSRHESYVRLRYEYPEMGGAQSVDIPQYDELKTGALRSIADQCGAKDFYSWYEWIERTL